MWGFSYFSRSNFDMLSGSMCGSMNLFMNQAFMHSSVWPSLFEVPTFGLNFNSYSSYTGSDYLLDPNYALQMTNKAFGLNCSSPYNTGVIGSPFTNGMINGPVNGPSNAPTGQSVLQDQYNELKAIAQALISSGKLGGRATELNQQLNNGETLEEKVRNLKTALMGYANDISDLLKSGNCTLKIGSKTIPDLLREAGVGFAIQRTTIDNLFIALQGAMDEQQLFSSTLGNYDILEIISCYQSSNTNILQAIREQDNYKDNITAYICERLINKASVLANSSELSEESRTRLSRYIEAFRVSIKPGDAIDDDMVNAFNDLYIYTKLAAARIVDYGLQNTYGDVLDGITDDDVFYAIAKDQIAQDFPDYEVQDIILDESKVQQIESFNQRNRIVTTPTPVVDGVS